MGLDVNFSTSQSTKNPQKQNPIYKPGDLFKSKPAAGTDYIDFTQGAVGNCYFLAGLNALSLTAAGRKAIERSIEPIYGVHPKDSSKQIIKSFKVKMYKQETIVSYQELIRSVSGKDSKGEDASFGMSSKQINTGLVNVDFVNILELAFAKLRPTNWGRELQKQIGLVPKGETSFDRVTSGKGREVFEALMPECKRGSLSISRVNIQKPSAVDLFTGFLPTISQYGSDLGTQMRDRITADAHLSSNISLNPEVLELLNKFPQGKYSVVLATKGLSGISRETLDPKKQIFAGHAYSLKLVDPQKQEVSIEDPKNTKKTVKISYKDFFQYFSDLDWVEMPS